MLWAAIQSDLDKQAHRNFMAFDKDKCESCTWDRPASCNIQDGASLAGSSSPGRDLLSHTLQRSQQHALGAMKAVLGNINRTITNRPKWSLPSVQHPSDYTWKDPGSLLRWEMMAIKQQVDSSNWVYMKTITARTIIRISAITGCGICPWRTELRDLTDESPKQPDLYSVFNLLWAGGWTR